MKKLSLLSQMVFEGMERAFARAKNAHPDKVFESSFILADQPVEMRIVGREFAETIGSVFTHLQTNSKHSTPTRLVVELWDQRETGIRSPAVSTRDDLYLHPVFMSSGDGRYVIQQLQYSMTCLDRKSGYIIGSIQSVDELSLYERARPFRAPLTIWHNDHDIPVIHTGLVSRNDQGVLFSGLGGAGKTTSALTCLCAGFSYLSEDLVGLQILPDGQCLGHSLYNSTFLGHDHLTHFPILRPHAIKSRYAYEDKLLIMLSQVFPSRLKRVSRITAVALPKIVSARRSRVRRASKGEALLVLAPSSLLQVPASPGIRGFNKLAQLVERVPCYWLELGSNLEEIPGYVEEILRDAIRS